MRVLTRRRAMADLAAGWRRRRERIGLVPTMGALHAGHASLIERARRECRRVAVSIFVNPKQFGPREDLSRYPRTLAADLSLCRRAGADAVYAPPVAEVYPEGFSTFVEVPGLSDVLEGEVRPGHFRGVATVVLKLLETADPDRAYFGEKDFQQLQVVRRMARDLDLRAGIVACPTVRDEDGLALSSRNRYLSARDRALAPALREALLLGAALARRGLAPRRVEARVRKRLLSTAGLRVDYARLCEASTLEPARRLRGDLRLLAAVRLGGTRLIDNVPVRMG